MLSLLIAHSLGTPYLSTGGFVVIGHLRHCMPDIVGEHEVGQLAFVELVESPQGFCVTPLHGAHALLLAVSRDRDQKPKLLSVI